MYTKNKPYMVDKMPPLFYNILKKICFLLDGINLSISVVKNIDISISIDTEISERYQY